MRFVVVLAALVFVAGCGEDDETEAPAGTPAEMAQLTVIVDTGNGTKKTADITCKEPDDSDVCAALADMDLKTFEPVPGNQACTQQYGGPETATVQGTLNGEEIDAKFSRVNGCEIARWDAAKKLLGASG